MRTAILSLLLIPLLLLSSVDGFSKNAQKKQTSPGNRSPSTLRPNIDKTNPPQNYITEWCTTSDRQLAPKDMELINCAKTNETCFADQVSNLCYKRSKLNLTDFLKDKDAGECTLNTIYGRYGNNAAAMKSAINTTCRKCMNAAKRNNLLERYKELECADNVPKACIDSFKNNYQKTDIGTPDMAEKWCGSYEGKTFDTGSKNGMQIAYKCYKTIKKESVETTTKWLTYDVAKCAFHSIVTNGTANHTLLIHEACEFFKPYGYTGYCSNFTFYCYDKLKPEAFAAKLCNAQTIQHLQPQDLKNIEEQSCPGTKGKEKGDCFARNVTELCKIRNNQTSARNIGQCVFHTLYYYNFGEGPDSKTLASDSAILTGCNKSFRTGFDCVKFNKTCRMQFQNPKIKPTDITEKVKSWCAVNNKINTKDLVSVDNKGEDIVYNCYKNVENKESPTLEWLDEKVGQCVFHSIFNNQTVNRTEIARLSCEYLKSFGFGGICGTFASECAKILEPVYSTTTSTTQATTQTTTPTSTKKPKQDPIHMTDVQWCGAESHKTVNFDKLGGCSKELGDRASEIIGKCNDQCNGEINLDSLNLTSPCIGTCVFTSIYRTCSEEKENIESNIIDIMTKSCEYYKKEMEETWNTENLKCPEYADKCYKKLLDVWPRPKTEKITTTSPTRSTVLTTFTTSTTSLPSTASTTTSTSTHAPSPTAPMETRPLRHTTNKAWDNYPTPPDDEDVKREDDDDDDGGRALRLQREKEEEEEKNKKEAENNHTSTYVGVSVGVGALVLILLIVVIIIVVKVKKRKRAKEEEAQKKRNLTAKSSVSSKADGKKQSKPKTAPKKPISEPLPTTTEFVVKEFQHGGPLHVDVGLHGHAVKHGTGENEGLSLREEVVFDETLNRVTRMGSDIELANSSELETAEGPETSKLEAKAEKSRDEKSKKDKKTEPAPVQTRKKPSKRPKK